MGTRITRRENILLINKRINQRDLQQYFNNFSKEDIENLSNAITQDDADSVADILLNNLSIHGRDLDTFFGGAYDSQYIDLGVQFVENYLKEKIVETRDYLKNGRLVDLNNILNDLDFDFPEGLKQTANSIRLQIKNSIDLLNVPERLRIISDKLAREKNFKITKDFYSRVSKWKDGRVVLEIRRMDDNRWKTYKILNKSDFSKLRSRKSELPKIEFKEPIRVHPKTVQELKKDMHGKPLNYREKLFLDNRLEEDFEKIWIDYGQSFGDVRSKDEFRKLVGERR